MQIFRHLFPHSLFGRFLIIIILPVIIVQLIATYIFYERHWESVREMLHKSAASEIAWLIETLEHTNPEYRIKVLTRVKDLHLFKDAELTTLIPIIRCNNYDNSSVENLNKQLDRSLNIPFVIHTMPDSKDIRIQFSLPDQTLLLRIDRKRFDTPTTNIFILWMIGSSLLFVTIAIFFMRVQVRAITRLADAAEALGKGMPNIKFKPEGAREVRNAGKMFLQMRERIERQIQQRTTLLAGVSHDLRTPITRVKLQLALIDKSEELQNIKYDIETMENIVNEYLVFVSNQASEEAKQEIDIVKSIENIANKYQDTNITLELPSHCNLNINSITFERVITNILDNAKRYSTSNIKITLQDKEKYIMIYIDDDGPGIDIEKRELVFSPFYRIDNARNLDNTSGTGLGLAIVKDCINSTGGDVKAEDSPLGGTRITIRIPR